MAEYFTEELTELTDSETRWLQEQFQFVYRLGDREYTAADLPSEADRQSATFSGFRFLKDLSEELDPTELGFDFQFTPDRRLLITADECGKVESLAHLVQQFLRHFRPSDYWALSYACSCSKPCLDAFGGGSIFVTADAIRFESSWDDIQRQVEAHQAATA